MMVMEHVLCPGRRIIAPYTNARTQIKLHQRRLKRTQRRKLARNLASFGLEVCSVGRQTSRTRNENEDEEAGARVSVKSMFYCVSTEALLHTTHFHTCCMHSVTFSPNVTLRDYTSVCWQT